MEATVAFLNCIVKSKVGDDVPLAFKGDQIAEVGDEIEVLFTDILFDNNQYYISMEDSEWSASWILEIVSKKPIYKLLKIEE